MRELRLDDAFIIIREGEVKFGNRFYCRTVDLRGGWPRTVSLRSHGREVADADKPDCDCSFFGINPPGRGETSYRLTAEPETARLTAPEFDAPRLELTLRFADAVQQAEFTRTFAVYPDLPGGSVRNTLTSQVIPGCYWNYRDDLARTGNHRFPDALLESAVDSFRPIPAIRPIRSVEFQGRTDYHNQPVIEHALSGEPFAVRGNLCYLTDPAGNVILLLQEAPPSAERRDFERHDFRWDGRTLFSCGWGVAPRELLPGVTVESYRHTILFCDRGESPETVLKQYLTRRFPMREQEAAILVNPWGCGHFPEWCSADFLRKEITAAAAIGAELYQIDDSWQNGRSLQELTDNNRAIDAADFWHTSPTRLPEGFEPLRQQAKTDGIRLGLWCAPTYTRGFADWETFADLLIDYHRRYQFAIVKIDGVRLQSAAAERNLESMLRKVRHETNGELYFNLDTTNGQRPGYFRFLEYGSVFLENRYLQHGGVIAYHPEKTLRNLWLLSRYVRTQSLQIEVPAPDDVPPDRVPSPDPRDYDFSYWCAVALFANVLIWTAPSRLCSATRQTLQAFTRLHKTIRPALFSGEVRPILNCPDGKALTGFAVDAAGLRLIFRELACPENRVTMPTPDGRILAGTGELREKQLTLPPGSFVLWAASSKTPESPGRK